MKAKHIVTVIIVSYARDSGLTKFGITPGGGGPMGMLERSMAAGKVFCVDLKSFQKALEKPVGCRTLKIEYFDGRTPPAFRFNPNVMAVNVPTLGGMSGCLTIFYAKS